MSDEKKLSFDFVDIWLAISGEKEYRDKIINDFANDIKACLRFNADRMDVTLTEKDFEDGMQTVICAMLEQMNTFSFM